MISVSSFRSHEEHLLGEQLTALPTTTMRVPRSFDSAINGGDD